MRVAVVDGVVFAEGAPAISPFDRGLLYGEGVFETLRTYRRRVFAWDEHAARLEQSAVRVGVTFPCPRATLAAETRVALDRFDGDEAIVRVVVTAGDGSTSTRAVLVEPLPPQPPARDEGGVSVVTGPASSLGVRDAKTTSYLGNLLARRAAHAASADEMVFVDDGGNILEGATSNVFVVQGRRLRTPALDGRLLGGVTRAYVIACARRLGLAIEEGTVTALALTSADEAFLTSTLREVAPIARVDGVARPSGAITERLGRAFREAAEANAGAW